MLAQEKREKKMDFLCVPNGDSKNGCILILDMDEKDWQEQKDKFKLFEEQFELPFALEKETLSAEQKLAQSLSCIVGEDIPKADAKLSKDPSPKARGKKKVFETPNADSGLFASKPQVFSIPTEETIDCALSFKSYSHDDLDLLQVVPGNKGLFQIKNPPPHLPDKVIRHLGIADQEKVKELQLKTKK